MRRVDLRADATEWRTESLPHELTHVVLADRFAERRIPSWADEGIAMLAESPGKLRRRCEALHAELRIGRVPSIQSVVNLTPASARPDPDAFYGQSVALVAFLLERGTPEQLLQFVELGQSAGYAAALRDVYDIENWSILEQGWRSVATPTHLYRLARHQVSAANGIYQLTSDREP